jgi:unsaturated rhamnogalacturonyl hydrolase
MSVQTSCFASRAIVVLLLSSSLWGCSNSSPNTANGAGGHATNGGASAGGTSPGGTSAISGNGGTSLRAGGTSGDSSNGGSSSGGSATGGSSTAGSSTAGSSAGGSGGNAQGGTSCPTSAEFSNWPDKTPLDVGKAAVNDFLSQTQNGYGGTGNAGDGYAWAFAYFGALQFTKTTNDTATNAKLISDYAKFLASGLPLPPNGPPGGGGTGGIVTGVDQRAFGDLPLEVFLENQDQAAQTLGLSRADMQWTVMNDDKSTKDARWWADDMFMITGLQVFAYRATKKIEYLDRAVKMMRTTFTKLQHTDGLFWHTEKTNVYWGRANGWVAAGMTELLLEMPPGADRDAIMAGYKKMMDGLLKTQLTQAPDPGAWNQVLDVSTPKPEMSCTAMFTYALTMGVKNGWLTEPKYATAARNGFIALAKRTDGKTGQLAQVCPGTGDAFYDAGVATTDVAGGQKFYMDKKFAAGDRHGQAPLIWAARALLRTDCPGMH